MKLFVAKHPFKLLPLLFLVLMLSGTAVLAQDMQYTTSSPEARQLFLQGLTSFENIDYQKALPLFDQAIQKDPGFAMAYLHKSFAETDPVKSREAREKGVSLKDKVSEGEQVFIDATVALAKGETEKSISLSDRLATMFPTDKHVLLIAGYTTLNLNNAKKALDYATKAIAIDKNFAPAYNVLGYAQINTGDLEGAEKSLKTYVTLVPDQPNPHDSYAELLQSLGKYDESIEHYTMALKLDPSFYSSDFGIGHNYAFKGDFARAREYYKKGIETAHSTQGRIDGLMWIAASYLHEGKTDEAVKTLEERQAFAMEKEQPDGVRSYSMAGMALIENGKPAEAMKYYDKAADALKTAKLTDDERTLLKNRIEPARAYALAANHQFDAARAEIQKAKPLVEKRNDPNEMQDFHTLIGLVESEAGNTDEALNNFSMGNPLNPVNNFHWALALEKKGDNAKAQELFNKVAKSNRPDFRLALVRTRAIEKSGGLQAGHPDVK
jgi:tetratricopeptide (TPR) repeat protein